LTDQIESVQNTQIIG